MNALARDTPCIHHERSRDRADRAELPAMLSNINQVLYRISKYIYPHLLIRACIMNIYHT